MTDNSPTDSAFDASAESRQSSVRMDVHGMTHVGRKRATNEDQFLIADLKKSLRIHQTSLGLDHQTRLFGGSQGKLLLVADGMGAPAIGDSPSNMESSRWSNTLWNVLGGDSDDLARMYIARTSKLATSCCCARTDSPNMFPTIGSRNIWTRASQHNRLVNG